jgi:hypothetical protein
MHRLLARVFLFGTALLILIVLGLSGKFDSPVSMAFQSEIPTLGPLPPAQQPPVPLPTLNSNYVPAIRGGLVYCGSQQSPVFVQAASGYITTAGAEIRCDPIDSLSGALGTQDAWDDQGYLIGMYPTPPALLVPLQLVFVIDRARSAEVCATCWSASFYDANNKQWQSLPTVFDKSSSRITVSIARVLPPAQYSGFAERGIVALFAQISTPTPLPSEAPGVQPTAVVHPTSTFERPTSLPASAKTATPVQVSEVSSGQSKEIVILLVAALVAGVFIGAVVAILLVNRRGKSG